MFNIPHSPLSSRSRSIRSTSVSSSTSTSSEKVLNAYRSISTETINTISKAQQHYDENIKMLPRSVITSLAYPELPLLSLGAASLLISSGVTMAVPIGFGKIVDVAQNATHMSDSVPGGISTIGITLGSLFAVGALSSCIHTYAMQLSQARVIARIRKMLFKSLLARPTSYFDTHTSGELVSVLSADVNVLSAALSGETLASGIKYSLQFCASFGIMMYLSPHLTAVMMGVAPCVAATGWFYGKFIRKVSADVQSALSKSTAIADERLADIRTVKAFVKESLEEKRYGISVDTIFGFSKQVALASSLFSGFTSVVGNVSLLAVLGFGSHLVVNDTITAGTLTSFMFYSLYLGISIVSLSRVFGQVMGGLGAGKRVFALINNTNTPMLNNTIPPIATYDDDEVKGDLEFRDVYFHYPTRPNASVLKGFSLHIEAGTVTAVVGQSGCGKSTLASLLLRLYDIQSGQILLDGRNISELDLEWLRSNIGIVSQEPTLFSGSVYENIEYGRENASREDVMRCACLANASEFIENFPDGYNTLVGQNGHSVSGGQKQRIAIARALLKDPAILILDEATSALDAQSEQRVQEALERLMVNRTTLLIAHSQAAIQRAQSIAMLQDGVVVARDTHDNLMSLKSIDYTRLIKMTPGA